MPLITLQEVKSILQLTTDESYDETIIGLIPFVRDLLCFDILQNTFHDNIVYYTGNTFTFNKASSTITDSLNQICCKPFCRWNGYTRCTKLFERWLVHD